MAAKKAAETTFNMSLYSRLLNREQQLENPLTNGAADVLARRPAADLPHTAPERLGVIGHARFSPVHEGSPDRRSPTNSIECV
jgi:hypothetical protein